MPDPMADDPLVPRHRGFDGFGMAEDGQVFGGEEHLDAARLPQTERTLQPARQGVIITVPKN